VAQLNNLAQGIDSNKMMSLETKNLSIVYRDGSHSIQALEEVSVSLVPGKCIALVGESGSGKTTFGNACMGLLPSNAEREGEIILNDKRIDNLDEFNLNELRWEKISMVFQNGAVNMNPLHRIIDQVAEPLIHRRSFDRAGAIEAASDALVKIGVGEEYHHRYPHQLSGGQVQRALIAMALILDPEILILDEPTSALDALSKGAVSDVITTAKLGNKSVLLITHDLEFAVHNSDTIIMLYLGQIMETLPADDMLTRPLHPYTLALGRSYPAMSTTRDLGGIRGDAFYRLVHQHGHHDELGYRHTHIQIPESSHKDGHAPPTGCLFQNRCTQAVDTCRTQHVELETVGDHTVRCLRHGIVNLLELKGVNKTYGKIIALHPTDLTIKCGEVFSLVGETGSGKTTLAMTSAGMLKPDNGNRVFDGYDMDTWMSRDYRSLSRRIGVVYQNPAESVSHRFSVFDIVAEPLKIHGLSHSKPEINERVIKVLHDVHLSTDAAFLGRYPHELNMGAIQRVCMARAIVLDPSLLIADEPTSSLDPSIQAKVLKLLLDLQIERGLSMLFITHDIGLARKISDRIGVMLEGRLVEIGPAHLILSSPLHPYTRLLIDSVSGLAQEPARNGSAQQPTGGCMFYNHCHRAQDICLRETPLLKDYEHGQVACHFPLTPG
jgi:peptide/nickel transport system ATP-binding protein